MFTQCHRLIDRLRLQARPIRDQPRRIILYIGETGTGKTRAVFDEHPNLYEVTLDKDLWYDGYANDEVALFDEFDGQLTLRQAKLLFDNFYVRKQRIKGSFVWFNPSIIYITSNNHPRRWWDFDHRHSREDEAAIRRRFTDIYVFRRTILGNTIRVRQNLDTFWPLGGPIPGMYNRRILPTPTTYTDGTRYSDKPLAWKTPPRVPKPPSPDKAGSVDETYPRFSFGEDCETDSSIDVLG